MAPTDKLLYVNYIGDLDVSSTRLAYAEGIQAHIVSINNKSTGQ